MRDIILIGGPADGMAVLEVKAEVYECYTPRIGTIRFNKQTYTNTGIQDQDGRFIYMWNYTN